VLRPVAEEGEEGCGLVGWVDVRRTELVSELLVVYCTSNSLPYKMLCHWRRRTIPGSVLASSFHFEASAALFLSNFGH
jgi:hypothetical protein